MALPKSIQAQVEAADAALAAMNQPAEVQEVPVAPLTPDQPQAKEAEPPQAASPAPQPQPDPWEHKYKTLQGRYNSDVPALQTQVKELKTQLETAISKLDEVAKPAAKEQRPVVDPQDVEAFGSDLVGMVQRVAERMFGGAAKDFKDQAARLEQRLAQVEEALKGTSQTVAVTAEQAFFDRLAKLVPNWEEINANQAFLDWLAEVDPVYGQPRQVALNAAQQSLNAERAANVFKAFSATLPQQPKTSPVDKQVSPKASATAAPSGTDNKPVYTQKQITDFYNDVARGAYRSRPQELMQIEAKINAAIAEGRIR
jgi:hypothetical protein